jgi:hypothetical protein
MRDKERAFRFWQGMDRETRFHVGDLFVLGGRAEVAEFVADVTGEAPSREFLCRLGWLWEQWEQSCDY